MEENNIKLINYIGSKYKFLSSISPEIDKCLDCKVFIEPFMGGGSVLLNNGYKFSKSYGMDKIPQVIETFEQFKTITYKELEDFYFNQVCKFGGDISSGKNAFYNFRDQVYNEGKTKHSSLGLYYLSRSTINSIIRFGPRGFNSCFGRIGRGKGIGLTRNDLNLYQKRTLNTQFLSINFFDIPKELFTNTKICWFIDPPYYGVGNTGYKKIEKTQAERLLNIIKDIKGKVIYTGIEELNQELLSSWRMIELRKNICSPRPIKGLKKPKRPEFMFCNFE